MNFLIALQFMTRIPIPPIEFNEQHNFSNSVKYYPAVGMVIGAILMLSYQLLSGYLPPMVVGAILLSVNILITGGLHLDGFMDTVDGLMSARDKEQMLAIMKDSRVGGHSVWAVICLLLLKFSLFVSISPLKAGLLLFFMPIVARWLVIYSMAFWNYGRERGLGKLFLAHQHHKSFIINGVLIGLLLILFGGLYSLLGLLTTIIAVFIINNSIVKKIDGLTGDTYGAVIELSEVIFLLTLFMLS